MDRLGGIPKAWLRLAQAVSLAVVAVPVLVASLAWAEPGPHAGVSDTAEAAAAGASGAPLGAAADAALAAAAASVAVPAPPGGARHDTSGLLVDTALAAAVRPGELMQVVVLYTNTTSTNLADVVIDNTLSAGQDFDGQYTATPAIPSERYTHSGLTMQWRIPSLAPGASGRIQFATTVHRLPEPSAEQAIRLVGNSARITAVGTPPDEDSAVATVVGPILEVDASASPSPVLPGRHLVYAVQVNNLSRQDAIPAPQIVVTMQLPAETAFVSASHGGNHPPGSRHVVWHRPGPLAPGSSDALSVTLRVSEHLVAPTQLILDRDHLLARASTLMSANARGKRRLAANVAPLLNKTAEGPRTFGVGAVAYPGDPVTYTLVVNNPRPEPLTGVQITDTLPGNPVPFTFGSMAIGDQPTIQGGHLVWTGIDLPAWGSVTFRYTARVPRNTFIGNNSTTGTVYGSEVNGRSGAYTFPPSADTGRVRVFPPVTMDMKVKPSEVQAGGEVVYTITLRNSASFPVTSIRLTDTFRGEHFRYTAMVDGPPPLAGLDTNPVVWSNLEVSAGGTTSLSFVAIANGRPLASYASDLAATSPDTFIPARTLQAQVKIDSPFRVDMSVDPEKTTMDAPVRYDFELRNVTLEAWTLDRVTNTLPAGLYDSDTGKASGSRVNNPPVAVPPGETWTASFNAYVSGDLNCAQLPRAYPTMPGNVLMQFSAPLAAVFGNASQLAGPTVAPHVTTYLTATRSSVLPDGQFLYHLRLRNDTAKSGTNAAFKIIHPDEFRFLGALQGQAPTLSGNELRWSAVQLAPHSDHTYIVAMQAGDQTGQRTARVEGSAEGVFCIQQIRNTGRVDVRDDVVLVESKPLSTHASPSGPADFEIKLINRDPAPYPIETVTNTLPAGFTFLSMLTGPEPTEVVDGRLIWRNVVIPGQGQLVWRMRLRAPSLYGAYMNHISAYTPETRVRPHLSSAIQVVPLIQLTKVASVSAARPGSSVAYTITLLNLTSNAYTGVRITDTLPSHMTYERMILGDAPSEVGPGRRRPVWNNLSIQANGGVRTLVFEAKIAATAPEGVLYNQVDGYSPNVAIPGTDLTAPVQVSGSAVPPQPTSPGPVEPTHTPRSGSSETPQPTDGPPTTPTEVPTLDPRLIERVFLPQAHKRGR